MPKTEGTVFIITNNLPPINDGVGHYSYNLYNGLKENGIDVKILTNRVNSFSIYLNNPDIIELGIDIWNWSSCWKFFNVVHHQKPNWLLIQYVPYSYSKNGFPVYFTFFVFLLRMRGIQILVTFHEISIRFFDNGFKSIFRAILQRSIAYILCSISTNVLTSNRYYASLLQPFKSAVISIPSNFENLISNSIKTELDNNNLVFITSTANRCYDTFFETISLFAKNCSNDLVVNITGRADDLEIKRINDLTNKYGLNKIIKCKVNLSENKYCTILRNTHIFIHLEFVSTNGEGGVSTKSGVVATAMAYGLPIITTCGDMTDFNVFKNNENLLFVPYDNPYIAVREIQMLTNNISLRSILSNNARDTYKNYMQWPISIKYYLSIL